MVMHSTGPLGGQRGDYWSPSEPSAMDRFENYIDHHWPIYTGNIDSTHDLAQLYVVTAGLHGECGELVEHFKKHVRDGTHVAGPSGRAKRGELDRDKVRLEFGDALHYLVRLARMHGFTVTEIIDANIAKLEAKEKAKAAKAKAQIQQAANDPTWRDVPPGFKHSSA